MASLIMHRRRGTPYASDLIAVTGSVRSGVMPDVLTFAALGYPFSVRLLHSYPSTGVPELRDGCRLGSYRCSSRRVSNPSPGQ